MSSVGRRMTSLIFGGGGGALNKSSVYANKFNKINKF